MPSASNPEPYNHWVWIYSYQSLRLQEHVPNSHQGVPVIHLVVGDAQDRDSHAKTRLLNSTAVASCMDHSGLLVPWSRFHCPWFVSWSSPSHVNIVTPNQERIYRDFWEILAYLLVYLVGREKSVTYIVVTVSDMYVLKTKVSILCFLFSNWNMVGTILWCAPTCFAWLKAEARNRPNQIFRVPTIPSYQLKHERSTCSSHQHQKPTAKFPEHRKGFDAHHVTGTGSWKTELQNPLHIAPVACYPRKTLGTSKGWTGWRCWGAPHPEDRHFGSSCALFPSMEVLCLPHKATHESRLACPSSHEDSPDPPQDGCRGEQCPSCRTCPQWLDDLGEEILPQRWKPGEVQW